MSRMCLLVSAFVAALVSVGCTSYKPSILAACEEGSQSTILKWETFPVMKGELKVYASNDPNNIPLERPIATTNISEQMLMVHTAGEPNRKYYTMVFNDEFPITIASRRIFLPGTQNFRDVGGYFTASGKEVKWGMLYRSDALDSIGRNGERILRGLGVKTIIDLRSPKEVAGKVPKMKGIRRVNIPLMGGEGEALFSHVYGGTLRMDSLRLVIRQMNVRILEERDKELSRIFQILGDEKNYPIAIECSSGKMRTGLVTALLLGALGVNYETVVQDYELSNTYFHIPLVCRHGYSMPEDIQEVLTALYQSRAENLDDVYEYILAQYKGIDGYIHHKLGVSQKELKKIRRILLNAPEE